MALLMKSLLLSIFGISLMCIMIIEPNKFLPLPNQGLYPAGTTHGFFVDNRLVFLAVNILSIIGVVVISVVEKQRKRLDKPPV